ARHSGSSIEVRRELHIRGADLEQVRDDVVRRIGRGGSGGGGPGPAPPGNPPDTPPDPPPAPARGGGAPRARHAAPPPRARESTPLRRGRFRRATSGQTLVCCTWPLLDDLFGRHDRLLLNRVAGVTPLF